MSVVLKLIMKRKTACKIQPKCIKFKKAKGNGSKCINFIIVCDKPSPNPCSPLPPPPKLLFMPKEEGE